MAKKPNLPIEVHDHFRRANTLHAYVQKSLGEATKHALEIGQELLAAKKAVPHGKWEDECDRLFDGSLRTAQFYMTFAKDVVGLKSATPVALLLDSTLREAAKTARKLARPDKPGGSKIESLAPAAQAVAKNATAAEISALAELSPALQIQAAKHVKQETCKDISAALEKMGAKAPKAPTPKPSQDSEPSPKEIVGAWADCAGRWLSKSPSLDELRSEFPSAQAEAALEAVKECYESLKKWQKKLK